MISTALLSVASVGMIGSFTGIQKALQISKSTTLAANLAQEQLQILKQKIYYQVLVTTSPAYDAAFAPPSAYDTGYFPPETIMEGGVIFTRYTLVEVVKEDSGVITVLPPATPDTGMKLVTVTVAWRLAGAPKRLAVRTIVANPDTVTANAIFTGVVRDAGTMAPIPGAVVTVAENLGWRDSSNASGSYSINASPGSYTLGTVVAGYFPSHRSVSIAANQTQTQDFTLVPMSSGSAVSAGSLWVIPDLLISQVVASTRQADAADFVVQFVELFNPGAVPVTIQGNYALNFQVPSGCTYSNTCHGLPLTFVRSSAPARGYFVVANTATFTLNGVRVEADAYWPDAAAASCSVPPNPAVWDLSAIPPKKQILDIGHGGSVWLTDSIGTVVDAVGWIHNANAPPKFEGAPLNLGSAGFADGIQMVRTSSPNFVSSAYGRSYDYGFNNVDFTTVAVQHDAFGALSPAQTLLAGRPAVGAIVSANDGLSLSTQAYSYGFPPTARFALTQVATGTWTMLVSSGNWTLQHDTVTIASAGSVFALPSTMTFLDTLNYHGFISGTVTDALGAPISPAVPVDPGGMGAAQYASVANGRYLLRVSTGLVDVTANSGIGAAASYVSVSSLGVSAQLGRVTSGVNFLLSQGGRVSGFVTRDGVNPLPGVSVTMLDANGYARDTQVSGSDGRFTSLNISTGSYRIEPALDEIETVSPSSALVTVTPGGTVFSATFTVSGALGSITGAVTAGGAPLRTGALIVVTTATLAGTPPAPPSLSSATLTGSPYYVASSREDGTYRVEVRQSTSPAYRVYAYYITYPGGAPTINAQSASGVQVLAGQTTTGVNFSW